MSAMAVLEQRQTVQYQEDHLYQNQTKNLGAFSIVVVVVSVFSMALRVVSRSITKQGMQRDDWTYLGGATLAVACFIVSIIYAFDAGLGEHWVALSPSQKTLFYKLNYAYNIFNLSCYPIIKISLLLLYLRIFLAHRFRQLCWVGIVFLSCMCIANTLVAIFACDPVRGFFEPEIHPHCINDVPFYYATAVLNVVTDLYILVLPMPLVWRLQTTFKRKLAISSIFVLGGLTFIVSIIRIVYYLDYSNDDPSYSFLGTAYATPAEVCLAVIVASAPTWRPVWQQTVRVASSLFSRSGGSSGDSFGLGREGTGDGESREHRGLTTVSTGREGVMTDTEVSLKSDATTLSQFDEKEKTTDGPLNAAPTTASSMARSVTISNPTGMKEV